jgi:fatty-acyl-CoA synthase
MPFTTSYFPADTSASTVDVSVGQLLLDAAEAHPDRVALVAAADPEAGVLRRQWTYAQLAEDASRVARALLERFAPGDHVAVWSANRYEWTLLEFGIALAGMVLVTVNPALRDREVAYVLAQSQAKGLLTADAFRDNDMLATLERVRPGLDHLREVIRLDEWDSFLASAGAAPLPDVDPNRPAQVQYTSGTTGFPKGALLRHISIVNNARFQGERMRVTGEDAVLNYMPLFHTGGCVNGTLIPAAFAATQVLMSGFTPHGAIRVAEEERCSVIGGVTTMYIMMLEQPDFAQRDLSRLRVGWTGGSTVPASLVRQIESGFGIQLSIVFGQTETSPTITQTRLDDADDDKANTVGQPLPCTEVKIVDPETGETVPVGEPGELCTRGYLTMRGYYEMPEATAATIDADGWLHTGDLCAMDERGYFSVQGRIRDMIKRGGENIYPREIEGVLVEHPAVADAAVVGVPDPKWSEQPAAFIRLAEGTTVTEAELVAHLRSHLAPHKTPRIWRFVDAFPLTPSGKVQKFVLRDQLMQEDGGGRSGGA